MNATPPHMKTPSYQEVFKTRAQAHVEAFCMYPDACRLEVGACLSWAELKPGDVLLDMPSAGGFLSTYVTTPDVHVIAIDPSPELHAHCAQHVPDSRLARLDQLPIEDATVDAIVCLAGLHHEPKPSAVFAEMKRVIKPCTGRVVIAEVSADSDQARFLNGFVNLHNPHGHAGVFVDEQFVGELKASGLQIQRDETLTYHWIFESRWALGDCLRRMFGIDLATPAVIAQAVEAELGIDDLPHGRVGMRWSLRFFLAQSD